MTKSSLHIYFRVKYKLTSFQPLYVRRKIKLQSRQRIPVNKKKILWVIKAEVFEFKQINFANNKMLLKTTDATLCTCC